MSRVCVCGEYLGRRTSCTVCGRGDESTSPPDEWPRSANESAEPADVPGDGDPAVSGALPARSRTTGGGLRGTVVEVRSYQARAAFGARPLQFLALAAVVGMIALRWEELTEGLVNLTVALVAAACPLFVLLAIGMAGKRAIPGLSGLGSRRWGGRDAGPRLYDAWQLLVRTPDGRLVEARAVVRLSFQGGEEVVLRGPRWGRSRHAWLMRVTEPYRATRIGRGLIRTVLLWVVSIVVVVDLISLG